MDSYLPGKRWGRGIPESTVESSDVGVHVTAPAIRDFFVSWLYQPLTKRQCEGLAIQVG